MRYNRFKVIFMVIFSLFLLAGCNISATQEDIDKLNVRHDELVSEITKKKKEIQKLNDELINLKKQIIINDAQLNPDKYAYILKLQLKEVHYTLNIGTHIKDNMNKVEFEIPVDKELYNQVEIGDGLVDSFRVGSLVMSGNLGNFKLTVVDKQIIEK